jgi:hypothetical protein
MDVTIILDRNVVKILFRVRNEIFCEGGAQGARITASIRRPRWAQ